jgi:hypothetical protein
MFDVIRFGPFHFNFCFVLFLLISSQAAKPTLTFQVRRCPEEGSIPPGAWLAVMDSATHLALRMSGAVSLLPPPHAIMAWAGTALHF